MGIKKFFCRHKWQSHAKEVYEWKEKRIVPGTEGWWHPVIEEMEYSDTNEILICQNCGQVKAINY